MTQYELSLDTSLLNEMGGPGRPISWRRAHKKLQRCGSGKMRKKEIIVDVVVLNAKSTQEKNMLKAQLRTMASAQLPKEARKQQSLI